MPIIVMPTYTPPPTGLTDAEKELRRTLVGASEVATVMGINPHESPRDLWLRKIHNIELPDTPAAKRGRRMERYILGEGAEMLSLQISRRNRRRVHANGTMQATVDAWVTGEPAILEAKKVMYYTYANNKQRWGATGSDHVPDEYMLQAQAQMAVASSCGGVKYDKVYLVALIGDDDLRVYHIKWQEQLIRAIETQVANWVQTYLWAKVEPPGDASLDVLRHLPRPQKNIAPVDEALVTKLLKLQDAKKRVDNAINQIKSQVVTQLGDSTMGRAGEHTITYNQHFRDNFDSDRLKREQPDLWKVYSADPTPVRRLTIH